jgi:hypothetical protein
MCFIGLAMRYWTWRDKSKSTDRQENRERMEDEAMSTDTYLLQPEKFRAMAYTLLLLTLGVGYVLTTVFNIRPDTADDEEYVFARANLTDSSYNNGFFFLDELPSKYIVIWLTELFTLSWVLFLFLTWQRLFVAEAQGLISPYFHSLCRHSIIFDFVVVTYFIEIYAVHPGVNFLMHTIPFTGLVLSVSVTGIRNVALDVLLADTNNTPSLWIWLEEVYAVVLTFLSAAKVVVQFMGIVLQDAPDPAVGQAIDVLWVLLAMVVPWAKAGLKVRYPQWMPKKVEFLDISFTETPVFGMGVPTIITTDGEGGSSSNASSSGQDYVGKTFRVNVESSSVAADGTMMVTIPEGLPSAGALMKVVVPTKGSKGPRHRNVPAAGGGAGAAGCSSEAGGNSSAKLPGSHDGMSRALNISELPPRWHQVAERTIGELNEQAVQVVLSEERQISNKISKIVV